MLLSIKVAVVGVGYVARTQHIPVLQESPYFELVCTVSLDHTVLGVPNFSDLEASLSSDIRVDLVVLCVPPKERFSLATKSLRAGKHVLLEKPPGISIGELAELQHLATNKELSLIFSWHSRHASMIQSAKSWLSDKVVRSVSVRWLEDVNDFHPNQKWIWERGGFGVFDAGINAISIVTYLLEAPYRVTSGVLTPHQHGQVYQSARFSLISGAGTSCDFDLSWVHEGDPCWEILLKTDSGSLLLSGGGNQMFVDETDVSVKYSKRCEYEGVYHNAHRKILDMKSDCDVTPLSVIADVVLASSVTLEERLPVEC